MFADVLVQFKVKSLDHTFTYHIPDDLKEELQVGMKVKVPFGKQTINGFVLRVHHEKDSDVSLKDILGIVTRELKLNEELLKLGEYIKEMTLCTLISAYQTMLPSSLKITNEKETYEKQVTYISLNKSQEEIEEYKFQNQRGKRQNELLELLKKGRILKSEIESKSSLAKLLELGLVREKKESVYRIWQEKKGTIYHTLTEEQEKIKNAILNKREKSETFLLHGITGSGKTEIYMQLCEETIQNGKNVLLLVPEISLTTQIVRRFYERFGNEVAIFHSSLSEGEKYDEYQKIYRGEVHIVVGTRSAIFTPLTSIGLIIIDEEHSSTYKQENNPRYHAIDIAKWRSRYHNCPLVLGSATPSLETMARALKGVYTYLPLNKRVGNALLPSVHLIDMAPEFKKRNLILSEELQMQIMKTLERKEQVMLLLNRRGYSTIITCQSCGYTYKCPHCDITLTLHKTSNHLRCHYCGYTTLNSDVCPECGEKAIRDFGLGTQKVEALLKELYPSYHILRMDADTTSKKGAHEKMIKAIERGEYDIIIGTQMISKGLDFPRVTLVGVINADESLNVPDFRSGENTFSLLSQVSGRAGRGDLLGHVYLQTFYPDNKTLQYVLKNDYMGNYQYEMDLRRKLKYPPYYYLVSLKIMSKVYESASREATKVVEYLKKSLPQEMICLGPTTASPFRINSIYRFQILIKYRKEENLKDILRSIDEQYIGKKDVYLEIDLHPAKI